MKTKIYYLYSLDNFYLVHKDFLITPSRVIKSDLDWNVKEWEMYHKENNNIEFIGYL